MEKSEKVKISSDLIFTKILLSGGLFIFLLLLQDYNKVPSKTFTEYILLIISFSVLLVYFFTRAGVYFDTNNLYIKKVRQKEIVIPLRNIKSINKGFFTSLATRNINFFSIKYLVSSKESGKIKFQADNNSENFSAFVMQVKKANSTVDIS